MSETQLSRDIQDALGKLGIWCIRIHSGRVKVNGGWMQLAESGTPDLFCPALGLWLEIKTPEGALEPSQVAWHRRATREGVTVRVVRSVSEAITAVTERRRTSESRAGGIDKGEGALSCQEESRVSMPNPSRARV